MIIKDSTSSDTAIINLPLYPLLVPYFNQYKSVFEEYGIALENFSRSYREHFLPSPFLKIKWKLRIRTRVKAWLYRLVHKL